MSMMCDARALFLKQRRFDLIFKYLYVVKPNNAFVRAAYLENIRAFNGYFELEPSDGIAKDTPEKFISSFDTLIKSMRENGFHTTQGGGVCLWVLMAILLMVHIACPLHPLWDSLSK